jgi:hypothetical protein
MFDEVLTHYWLRHPEDKKFHAYVELNPGTPSLCGRSPSITYFDKMDIPGDRSQCCLHCFIKLYKFDPNLVPKPSE